MRKITELFKTIKLKNCILILLGSTILSFGLYNIHSFSGVTEGGILGLTLLFKQWFNISPAASSVVMNVLCYAFGLKMLGSEFLIHSAIAGGGFALSYWIFEQFPPVYPGIAEHPFIASILGAVFVGVGVGIAVRYGGAPGGDDALAMGLSKLTKLKIQWIYLISDLIVLAMSLTYIPLARIAYSLLTVIISGQIVGFFQPKEKNRAIV